MEHKPVIRRPNPPPVRQLSDGTIPGAGDVHKHLIELQLGSVRFGEVRDLLSLVVDHGNPASVNPLNLMRQHIGSPRIHVVGHNSANGQLCVLLEEEQLHYPARLGSGCSAHVEHQIVLLQIEH